MWLAKRGVWSWAIVGMFAATISLSAGKAGRELRPVQSKTTTDDGDIEVLQLRPNFYMIAGAGGNIGVQVGVDGVVVVDSGSAAKADAVVAAIKKITTTPDPVCHQHQRRSRSCRWQRDAVQRPGRRCSLNQARSAWPPISSAAGRRFSPSNRS